jgi:hypothetical protein
MKLVNLAIAAARKRQSRETGFVHHSYETLESRDTIPLFENFCFALALLKTRMVDHVFEGRALLEKLLPFQVGSNFPIYIHEFPLCKDLKLGSKLYPVIFWILKEFAQILGEGLRDRLQNLLPLLSQPMLIKEPSSPDEWAEFLILAQMEEASLEPALTKWHPTLFCYVGHQKQEKFEPAITLYDLFMGEFGGAFSSRSLQDHPVHLRASLIQPVPNIKIDALPDVYRLSNPFTVLWGGKEQLHSLILDTKHRVEQDIIYLKEALMEDEIELSFFVSAQPENSFLVNGQKSNTFQLGDTIDILSQGKRFELKASLVSGEGRFFGHIFQSNRPGQIGDKKECYDWKISLRTVKRTGPCEISFSLESPISYTQPA